MLAGQFDQRGISQQYAALAIDRQYRIGHGREQGVELQVAALAWEDVNNCHGLYAVYLEQRLAQLVEHCGAQGRRVDIDVGRHHLYRVQVEIAPAEQGQHFLGDANAIDKGDVNTHGNGRPTGLQVRQYARSAWLS